MRRTPRVSEKLEPTMPPSASKSDHVLDQKPLISVVIPTYNRAEMVVAAIESVFAQTYPVLEVIVVDDGSADATAEAIRDFIASNSHGCGKTPEINYLYQPNQGQSRARNKGIAAARGDWVAFLDSDDIWFPEKIEWQVRAIERFKNECGACISDARLVDNSNMDTTAFRLAGKRYDEHMGILADATAELAKSFGCSWIQTIIVRCDLARQIGGFDDELHFAEDHDFLFRLSLATSYCFVNRPLALIERTNTATDPGARVRRWDSVDFRLGAQQHMYEKWLILSRTLPTKVHRAIIQNLRAVHSARANLHLQREQFDLARRAVSMAMSCEFTRNLAIKWALIRIAPRIAKKIAIARLEAELIAEAARFR